MGGDWAVSYNVTTDEGYYARNTTTGFVVNNFTPADPRIQNLWANCYTGINRANDIIANIDVPQMDETARQAILGEALFLRAYYHFILVSNFGDVPLKIKPTTTPNDVDIAATPIKNVYDQILKDMTDAEAKIHTISTLGHPTRVTKTVVQGILAKVCLHMAGYPLKDTSKYADALAWAKEVQTSGEHQLNTTFDPSFNVAVATPTRLAFTNNAYNQIFIDLARDVYNTKETM